MTGGPVTGVPFGATSSGASASAQPALVIAARKRSPKSGVAGRMPESSSAVRMTAAASAVPSMLCARAIAAA